jgi:hypothetical protein
LQGEAKQEEQQQAEARGDHNATLSAGQGKRKGPRVSGTRDGSGSSLTESRPTP